MKSGSSFYYNEALVRLFYKTDIRLFHTTEFTSQIPLSFATTYHRLNPPPLPNWHPPAAESKRYHWHQGRGKAVNLCMSAWLWRKTLMARQQYFDFMWYFSLNWLEHFNHGNSPAFPCSGGRAIQECRFISLCQFNSLWGEGRQTGNLAGEEELDVVGGT